jgi:hypothetical protein
VGKTMKIEFEIVGKTIRELRLKGISKRHNTENCRTNLTQTLSELMKFEGIE